MEYNPLLPSEAEIKKLKDRVIECGGEVFFGDIDLGDGDGYVGNSDMPVVIATPFSVTEEIKIRAVKVDEVGRLIIIGEDMDGDIIDPVEVFDIIGDELDIITNAIIIEEKTIWLRLGVAVKGSKTEIEKILEDGADTRETLLNLMLKKNFDITGETYIPAWVVENYNKENGTDFDEQDIDIDFNL